MFIWSNNHVLVTITTIMATQHIMIFRLIAQAYHKINASPKILACLELTLNCQAHDLLIKTANIII